VTLRRGGELLGGGQLFVDQPQPGVPEPRIGQVDVDDRRELLGAA
jgi:hypothetical protein